MVKYNRASLLRHPVVREYLHVKWRDYGRFIYYAVMIAHLLHVFFLSIFIAIVPLPKHNDDSFIPSINNTTNSTMSTEYKLSAAVNAVRVFTLLLCTINIVPVAVTAYILKLRNLFSL